MDGFFCLPLYSTMGEGFCGLLWGLRPRTIGFGIFRLPLRLTECRAFRLRLCSTVEKSFEAYVNCQPKAVGTGFPACRCVQEGSRLRFMWCHHPKTMGFSTFHFPLYSTRVMSFEVVLPSSLPSMKTVTRYFTTLPESSDVSIVPEI